MLSTTVFPLSMVLLLGHEYFVGGFSHNYASSSRTNHHESSTIVSRRRAQRNDIQEEGDESSTNTNFGFQTITRKPIIPYTVVEEDEDDPAEVAARQNDEPMFTASVRRDLYNVMRNPFKPHIGAPAPLSWWGSAEDDSEYEESSQFGGILLGKKEKDSASSSGATPQDIFYWDTYAFTDRMTYDPEACKGFAVLDDNQVVSAIAILGLGSSPHSITLTKAFEAWLSELAASHWGDLEVSKLSVEFLIAFGNELTERLGINHRILSTALTQDEMDILSEPPFAPYILPELLEDFQTSKIEVDEEQAEATASTLWWDQDENSPEY